MKRRTFLQALGLVPVAIAAPKLVLDDGPLPVFPAMTDKETFLELLDREMIEGMDHCLDQPRRDMLIYGNHFSDCSTGERVDPLTVKFSRYAKKT